MTERNRTPPDSEGPERGTRFGQEPGLDFTSIRRGTAMNG